MNSTHNAGTVFTARGIVAEMRDFLTAIARYAQARTALLGIEAREAGTHLGFAIGVLLAGFAAILAAYSLLVFASVCGLAILIGGTLAWLWASLVVALIHLGLAALLLRFAGKRFRRPLFPETIDQLKQDELWLHSTNRN